MSGFEIAGVVLGAIPLIIEAVKGYKAGRNDAAVFIKWRGLLDQLLGKLEFQRFSFYMSIRNLLQAAGIETTKNDHDACRKALDRPENQSLLTEYLGSAIYPFEQIVRNQEAYLKQLASKLSGIRRVPGVRRLKRSMSWLTSCRQLRMTSERYSMRQKNFRVRLPCHDVSNSPWRGKL